MQDAHALPGDRLAASSECAPGPGAYDDGRGGVRASAAGPSSRDGEGRACVAPPRPLSVPGPGDVVIGTVAAKMASRVAVEMQAINGRRVSGGVECVCSTRNRRERIVALVGDVMMLRIEGSRNGDIHASLSDPRSGVIFTRCRKCGGRVVRIRDGVKCADCGWADDRKMSSEYGKEEVLATLAGG